MDTHYSPEQEAFRTSLRRFLEDSGGASLARNYWDNDSGCQGQEWQALLELGVAGLLAPEAAGGLGGTLVDAGVVMEEMGRHVHPGPSWSACIGAIEAASALGLPELSRTLCSGEQRATLAVAEPGRVFTDWASPTVSANNNRLTGSKIEVPDGLGADIFITTSDDGVYLVEANAPGLSVAREQNLDGTRRFTTVQFKDTPGIRVGDNQALASAIDKMLVALCADGLGAAQKILELSVAHASERQQFGQPIGAFQAVQHLCADMLQQLELGRAGLHHALWAQDAGDVLEAHRSAVMCKAYMAEVLPQIGASAIQVFGGAGFTWEYDIQLYYKRLLSVQMSWGNAQTWLEELAGLVLDTAPHSAAG